MKYFGCKSKNANLQEDAFIGELDQEPKALPPETPAAMPQVNFSLVHFYPLNIIHHYLHITESRECAHLYCVCLLFPVA